MYKYFRNQIVKKIYDDSLSDNEIGCDVEKIENIGSFKESKN